MHLSSLTSKWKKWSGIFVFNMARARNIKPGFFINEDLVELPFSTRLLFIGLWTIADRAGRLDDRPKKIKMAVFPADDVDVDTGLFELAERGLLVRYIVDNEPFIQITNFEKHQSPHIKEVDSLIPAPDKHQTDTSLAALIPSSLIPESPYPRQLPPRRIASLPTGIESEITSLLDAVAPLTGAKSRQTMANPKRWREVVEIVVKEQHEVPQFLGVVKSELNRNKGTPQFFTPEGCLKALQTQQVKKDNGFIH